MTDRESQQRRPELDRLEVLVGTWQTRGEVISEARVEPMLIVGTDTYRWLRGRYFLVHDVDVSVGQSEVAAIELLGDYDPQAGTYRSIAFDNQGAITELTVSVDSTGVWRFIGGAEIAAAAMPDGARSTDRVRSTLTIAPDGQSMHALWERSAAADVWHPWMSVDFTK